MINAMDIRFCHIAIIHYLTQTHAHEQNESVCGEVGKFIECAGGREGER